MDRLTKLSRLLSFVLRHDPGAYGLVLDAQGWTDVPALLAAFAQRGVPIDLPTRAGRVSDHTDLGKRSLTAAQSATGIVHGRLGIVRSAVQ